MRLIPSLKCLMLVASFCVVGSVFAQAYPARTIRTINGYPPGNGGDLSNRLAATEMSKRLGQQMVVENRPGASYTIAAQAVAKAPPDGYTLFYGNATTPHPLFVKNNAVDAAKEFMPVAHVAIGPLFIFSRSSLPIKSWQELVAYSKRNPAKLNFGAATPQYDVVMQLLKDKTGVSFTTIPYKGGPAIIQSLASGEVDFIFGSAGAAPAPFLQAGSIRALVALSPKRSSLMPDALAGEEIGVPNLNVASVFGFWAPVGTPREILQRLTNEAIAAVKNSEVAEKFRTGLALEPGGLGPEEQMRMFESDIKFWTEATRLANFQPQ